MDFIFLPCLDRAELREDGEEGYLKEVNLLCEVFFICFNPISSQFFKIKS